MLNRRLRAFLGRRVSSRPGELSRRLRVEPLEDRLAPAVAFQPQVEYGAGTSPLGVATADFNRDGFTDAAFGTGSSVSIYLNDGTGKLLTPASSVSLSGNPSYRLAAGDLNNDGAADLAAITNSSTWFILLNDGAGGFTASAPRSLPGQLRDVAMGDFNRDGNLDVLLLIHGSAILLRGDGLGGGTETSFSGIGLSESLAVGDFNRDGKLDFIATEQNTDTLKLFLGDGAGGFGTPTAFSTGALPNDFPNVLAAADFNGDGKLDIAVTNRNTSNIGVLLGDGAGGFAAAAQYNGGPFPVGITAGDYDGDGKIDIAVTALTEQKLNVLRNNGDGTFAAPQPVASAFPGAWFAATADFDNDGRADIAFADQFRAVVVINAVPPLGNLTFAAAVNYTVGAVIQQPLAGDFNRDGIDDIVVTRVTQNDPELWLGNGSGGFTFSGLVTAGLAALRLAAGDFNRDGILDLAFVGFNDLSIVLGNGAGAFAAPTTYSVGTFPRAAVVADFNRDGVADVAVANNGSPFVSVLIGTGSGTFAAAVNINAVSGATHLATGDFNRDGTIDIVTSNGSSNTVGVLLGDGLGSFAALVQFPAGGDPEQVTVGDLNHDGKDDVVVMDNTNTKVHVLIGNGLGGFAAPVSTTLSGGTLTRVGLGDFDSDGTLDVLAMGPSERMLRGNGDGTLAAPVTTFTGDNSWDIAIADFNRDGRLDFVKPMSNGLNVRLNLSLSPPTVNAPTFQRISDTSASLGGNAVADGGAGVTERGIVYSLTAANASPTIGGAGVTKLSTTGGLGQFTMTAAGLTLGSSYSYAAYATNAQGTTYSVIATFRASTAIAVSNPTFTQLSLTSARLGGTITSDGGTNITRYGVVYALTSTNPNPTLGGPGAASNITLTSTTGSFSQTLSGLTTGVQYSYVAYIENASGAFAYSPVATFTLANLPVVATPTATDVAGNSATFNGEVTAEGSNPVTSRGFVFAPTLTNPNPTLGGVGVATITVGSGLGIFTTGALNLMGLTSYSLVAYATSSVGTTYSPVATFTTSALPPTIGSPTATGIDQHGATIGATVTSDGGAPITQKGVIWALTSDNPNPTPGGPGCTTVTLEMSGNTFGALVSGFALGTSISYVAFATNAIGTSYTSVATFTTTASPPTLNSPHATNITATAANLGGILVSRNGGDNLAGGVLYALTSVNPTPTLGGVGVTQVDTNLAASGEGLIDVLVSGLQPNSAYSYVAYTTNIAGTGYTPVGTFSTLAALPTVTGPTVTDLAPTTATLGGNVLFDNGAAITERGVIYSLTSVNANPQLGGVGTTNLVSAVGIGVFTVSAAGLVPGSAYSYVAYAKNSVGTAYSALGTFTAPATTPTVTSPTSTSVTPSTATLGGNVTANGGATLTQRGVVYALTSANPNPTLGGASVVNVTAAGTSTGVFTVPVTSLVPGSAYSFVAYATNSAGTTYSAVGTFTTPATTPTVVSPTSANITATGATLGGNVTATGGAALTQRGVVYALTSANPNPALGGASVVTVVAAGTSTGVFTAAVTGLAPGSAYSYVAFATNSVGTTYTTVAAFTTPALPTVSGRLFVDYDADGVRDTNEPGAVARTVYLDANGDGQLNGGERSAVTAADGAYTFTAVPVGAATLRAVALGFQQAIGPGGDQVSTTLAAGEVRTGFDLGFRILAPLAVLPVNIDVHGGTYASADAALIQGYYRAILGREGSDDDVAAWAAILHASSPVVVVQAFLDSDEHHALEVRRYYQTILNRTPAASEVSAWVLVMRTSSFTSMDLALGFLNSVEYTNKNPTSLNYVESLYHVLLGRDGDAASVTAWIAALDSGATTRSGMSRAFLDSDEARLNSLGALYDDLLHRPLDPAGIAGFTPLASTSNGLQEVLVAILASEEFFAKRTQ